MGMTRYGTGANEFWAGSPQAQKKSPGEIEARHEELNGWINGVFVPTMLDGASANQAMRIAERFSLEEWVVTAHSFAMIAEAATGEKCFVSPRPPVRPKAGDLPEHWIFLWDRKPPFTFDTSAPGALDNLEANLKRHYFAQEPPTGN